MFRIFQVLKQLLATSTVDVHLSPNACIVRTGWLQQVRLSTGSVLRAICATAAPVIPVAPQFMYPVQTQLNLDVCPQVLWSAHDPLSNLLYSTLSGGQ